MEPGEIRLPDLRLYYKATVIKTLWNWLKNRNIDQWNRTCKKNAFRRLPETIHKNKYKWIKDLNIRPDSIRILVEDIGRTFSGINCSKICFDPSPRVMKIKTTVNKRDLIKLKSFCIETEIETKQKDNP